MSTIFHVLQEEYERLQEAVELFSEKMTALPKGYIRIMDQGQRRYAYLSWREKGTVKTSYIAPVPSAKYEKAKLQVKKRKDYEERIRRMKNEIKDIRKALRHGKTAG